MDTEQLKRIADAMEEILRLVKKEKIKKAASFKLQAANLTMNKG